MKKKLFLGALLLCLTLSVTACAKPTNQDYYETAQLYLGSGEAARAARLFTQLGEYRDAADYALYCRGIEAMDEGDYALARVNLMQVDPFKSSGRYLRYLDALEAEAAGELEAALSMYRALGSFADCGELALALEEEIPERTLKQGRALMTEGDYEAAREIFLSLEGYSDSTVLAENCTVALSKAAYAEAEALCEAGDHEGAYAAFTSLGEVLDAPERAQDCLDEVHTALDEAFTGVTLETASDLLARCEQLPDDVHAQEIAAQIRARFGMNLALLQAASTQPYVTLGAYPTAESGTEKPLIWQVIRTQGTELTLLCQSVIDASPVATTTDLFFTEQEESAVTTVALPAAADLATLTDLSCTATPYAVAQGVEQEDGQAPYWLRDSLESGMHPVVSAGGMLTLPAASAMPGVRPLMTISLADYAFTAGSGTQEDPFR